MYFLFNADLSKFDSQYYNIRYIHSLLLNSGVAVRKTLPGVFFQFKTLPWVFPLETLYWNFPPLIA